MKVQEDAPMGSGEWGGRPSRILAWSSLYHFSVEAGKMFILCWVITWSCKMECDRDIRQLKQYSSSMAKESLAKPERQNTNAAHQQHLRMEP